MKEVSEPTCERQLELVSDTARDSRLVIRPGVQYQWLSLQPETVKT